VQPDKAFWSRSVSNNFYSNLLLDDSSELFKLKDKVTSAGSCFASNLVPYIEGAGLTYLRTEQLPNIFSSLGENLGYANFSAAYGNIYTTRQLLQLYLRSLNDFRPKDDNWLEQGYVIDAFRPGLKFPASSVEEFELHTKSHLHATREAFETADVFVYTFGLTETWVSRIDGAAYPACPGTIAGTFDPKKYEFRNFTVEEIVSDMSIFIEKLRGRNPKVRFILSVSPVPLVATATNQHVLTASTYSKSVLRVASDEVSRNFKDVTYFPAYEIITGPQAPKEYFEDDRRNVSKLGVEEVMSTLIQSSGLFTRSTPIQKQVEIETDKAKLLSSKITQIECDEVMLDDQL
jgi:hypothetical protein